MSYLALSTATASGVSLATTARLIAGADMRRGCTVSSLHQPSVEATSPATQPMAERQVTCATTFHAQSMQCATGRTGASARRHVGVEFGSARGWRSSRRGTVDLRVNSYTRTFVPTWDCTVVAGETKSTGTCVYSHHVIVVRLLVCQGRLWRSKAVRMIRVPLIATASGASGHSVPSPVEAAT